MEEITKENNQVLKKEKYINIYGKVYEVNTTIEPDGDDSEITKTFYFIKPKTQSFSRYIKKVSTDAHEAATVLLLDNIIGEQQDELKEFIDEYPGAALSMHETLLRMLGLAKSVNFKKL